MKTSHLDILIRELARRGGRVTYAQLMARYPDHDYDGFAHAVYRARKDGLVERTLRASVIVAVGDCPCCGRPLRKD